MPDVQSPAKGTESVTPGLHAQSALSRPGRGKQSDCVDQVHIIEHHLRRDEGRLLKVYDKTQPELTMQSEMEDVNVSIHETPPQMQLTHYRGPSLGESPRGSH